MYDKPHYVHGVLEGRCIELRRLPLTTDTVQRHTEIVLLGHFYEKKWMRFTGSMCVPIVEAETLETYVQKYHRDPSEESPLPIPNVSLWAQEQEKKRQIFPVFAEVKTPLENECTAYGWKLFEVHGTDDAKQRLTAAQESVQPARKPNGKGPLTDAIRKLLQGEKRKK
jgi:hypothetical protein